MIREILLRSSHTGGHSAVKYSLILCVVAIAIGRNGHAQVTEITLPDFSVVDSQGVDILSQSSNFSQTTVQIGPDDRALAHSMVSESNHWPMYAASRDNFMGFLHASGYCPFDAEGGPYDAYSVNIGGAKVKFCLKNGTYVPNRRNGEALVNNGNGTHTFRHRDGTEYLLDSGIVIWGYGSGSGTQFGTLTEINRPKGLTTKIHFKTASFNNNTWARIQSVTQNNGYQLKYTYQRNAVPSGGVGTYEWVRPTSIKAINNTVDYCAPTADICTYSRPWPTATIGYSFPAGGQSIFTVTDPEGRATRYSHESVGPSSFAVVRVKAPTSAGPDTVTYEYDDLTHCDQNGCQTIREDLVVEVTIDSAEWSYIPTQVPYHWYTRRTGPTGRQLTVFFNSVNGLLEYVIKPNGAQATFTNDAVNRLDYVTFLEGNKVEYTYDDRGNITVERNIAKPGSSLSDIVRVANYDVSCSNPKTCNKPNWVEDGRGGRTEYEYYPNTGLLESITWPQDANGIRPQTRYEYTQHYAGVKNASGNYVPPAEPVWLLTEESYCRTSAATPGGDCATSGDEVVTAYNYGPPSGPNNLQLRGVVVTSNGQSLRTCFSYDSYGNKIGETAPRAGLSACP